MRLSISRILLLIFILIGLLSAVAVTFVGEWVQTRSVNSLAQAESRRHAELIFQNLYSVMRKGWSKEDIRDLVRRINQSNPDLSVSVHRSAIVAADFGDIESDRRAREYDPLIAQAMQEGKEQFVADTHSLRFIYPILVGDECVSCHDSAQLGDVNGVLDIRVPLAKLRLPLEFTLQTVVGVFALLITLLFLVTLIIVRQAVAHPMHRLARLIDGIVTHEDLSRRVDGRAFRWLHEVRSLGENFNRLMDQLQASRDELIRQSTTDPLTGLSNRRHFREAFHSELERARRYRHPLAVIMMDLDGFKPINDRWGHAAGDDMLRQVASALRHSVRGSDIAARLGGDEFAILAPECDPTAADILAQKLVKAIDAVSIQCDNQTVRVGVSMGIGIFPEHGQESDAVLAEADQRMYADKQRRKTRQQAIHQPITR